MFDNFAFLFVFLVERSVWNKKILKLCKHFDFSLEQRIKFLPSGSALFISTFTTYFVSTQLVAPVF